MPSAPSGTLSTCSVSGPSPAPSPVWLCVGSGGEGTTSETASENPSTRPRTPQAFSPLGGSLHRRVTPGLCPGTLKRLSTLRPQEVPTTVTGTSAPVITTLSPERVFRARRDLPPTKRKGRELPVANCRVGPTPDTLCTTTIDLGRGSTLVRHRPGSPRPEAAVLSTTAITTEPGSTPRHTRVRERVCTLNLISTVVSSPRRVDLVHCLSQCFPCDGSVSQTFIKDLWSFSLLSIQRTTSSSGSDRLTKGYHDRVPCDQPSLHKPTNFISVVRLLSPSLHQVNSGVPFHTGDTYNLLSGVLSSLSSSCDPTPISLFPRWSGVLGP